MSLYDQVCKLLSHPIFQKGMKRDRKGNKASGIEKWHEVDQSVSEAAVTK